MDAFDNQLALAKQGSREAMIYVADNYFYGVDIVGDDLYQDMIKARHWYERAGNLGSRYAVDMSKEVKALISNLKDAA